MINRFISPPLAILAFALFITSMAWGQEIDSVEELKKLSLEDLFHIEVTTASRKPQLLFRSASAVDVITAEDIRRSGALSIPDILRLAAGLHVARFDSRTWAISARGLNLTTSNKMQIRRDGRILQTPLFSGVFWDVQDYILTDIDRIEIIRGPGAALWGANAVNGVINIITKDTRDTQGTLVEAGVGNEERGVGSFRYGGHREDSFYYRGYARFFSRDDLALAAGEGAEDNWHQGRGGFRMDSHSYGADSWTLQGDAYRGSLDFPDRDSGNLSGANLIGRWIRNFSDDSNLQVQLYYDYAARKIPLQFQESRNTFDLDLQHRFQLTDDHDLVWGANYRASADETENIGTVQFVPQSRTIHLFSGFIQDEMNLVEDRLGVIVGSKFEKNTFTGLEIQPTVRLVFTPTTGQIIWGAVSRAVREPSRIDTDLRFFPVPGFLAIQGNPDFRPEELIAYELGYRIRPHARFLFEADTFYHVYDSLITVEPGSPGEPPTIGNGVDATLYGGTISTHFSPNEFIRMRGSVSLLHKDLDPEANSNDLSNGAGEGNDPDYFWTLHSMIDPSEKVELDVILRSVGDLETPFVPGYVTLDFRIAWQASRKLELSIAGRDLLEQSHPEFGEPAPTRKEVERSVFLAFRWLL